MSPAVVDLQEKDLHVDLEDALDGCFSVAICDKGHVSRGYTRYFMYTRESRSVDAKQDILADVCDTTFWRTDLRGNIK